MKKYAALLLLVVSGAQATPPLCYPFIPQTSYQLVTNPRLGETPTVRWVSWKCIAAPGSPVETPSRSYCLVGSKMISWTTVMGRLGTIEKSTNRRKSADSAWNRYVTLPDTDPVAIEGLAACRTAGVN